MLLILQHRLGVEPEQKELTCELDLNLLLRGTESL